MVINEELFRGILSRERKRSDRSDRVLLLVEVRAGRGAGSSSRWESVVEALTAAKREVDILGWLEWGTAIGLIVPEVRPPDLVEIRERLDGRIRRELASRVDAATIAGLSTRLHVYPEPRRDGDEAPWPVDPLLYPELSSRRQRGPASLALKRALDVIGSLTLLALLAPLLLLIAALVKSKSRGPVLFRQVRIGQMMKPFTILKFRTMYVDAGHARHQEFVTSFIGASGEAHHLATNGVFKITDDPRVTPVGRMLRKTSLDELPQLWNVLGGSMSLVGPRPPLPYELEQYKPWHRRRVLEAKPGITGLWQVAGRSQTTFNEMVRLDLRYARTRSLWTDLKILLATPAAVISGKGAW